MKKQTLLLLITCISGFGLSAQNNKGPDREMINRNEAKFSRKINVEERMKHYNVPGVSIAVINDFQLEWARGYGVTNVNTSEPVTMETLFQSGSIGKGMVAATALSFVEDGKIHLDQNVNDLLKSWKVPDNSFTRRTYVSLRMLLSHSAGATLPGVIGYKRGEKMPDLLQIVNGKPPANTPPVQIDQVPGVKYVYSGGGYMIVQQLLMDIINSERTFPEIVNETVFNPLNMTNTTYDFNPDKPDDKIAVGHRSAGHPVYGKWYNYPEFGMGVFWTTPTDIAKFVSEIMLAYNGRSEKILSSEMARLMLTPQIDNQGLGLDLGDDGKDRFYFSHKGAVEGYQTFMVGYPKRGQGVVIMTNSDNGYPLILEILHEISMTYRWLKGIYL